MFLSDDDFSGGTDRPIFCSLMSNFYVKQMTFSDPYYNLLYQTLNKDETFFKLEV